MERCPADGADLCESEALERVGTMVTNYLVGEVIGSGGMGVVYHARQVVLDKSVAIKILNRRHGDRRGAGEEMLREARAASRIHHPHIVAVTDFGTTEDGAAFFVMEYLAGESLAATIGRRRRLTPGKAGGLMRQIASALAAAHQAGIVHRDLKPENIFLIDNGDASGSANREPDFVKVLDFGLAKILDLGPSNRTRAGMLAGTPAYMSPEQARNLDVDGRSDIYSLGVLYYQMVVGRPPFEAESAFDLLMAQVHANPADPRERCAEVDQRTGAVILRCLQKDPDRRYQTMEELLEALHDSGPTERQSEVSGRRVRPAAGGRTVTTELAGRVLGGAVPSVTEAPLPSDAILSASLSGPTVVSDLVARVVSNPDLAPDGTGRGHGNVGRKARRGLRWVLPAVAGVAGLAGVALLLSRNELVDTPKEQVIESPLIRGRQSLLVPPAGTAVAEEQVLLHLDGLPAGARVLVDGQLHDERPLGVRRSTEPRQIRVEAAGYLPEQRRVVPSGTQWLLFDLKRAASGRSPRLRARSRRRRPSVAADRRKRPATLAPAGRAQPVDSTVTVAAKPERGAKPKPPTGADRPREQKERRYRDWILEPKLE